MTDPIKKSACCGAEATAIHKKGRVTHKARFVGYECSQCHKLCEIAPAESSPERQKSKCCGAPIGEQINSNIKTGYSCTNCGKPVSAVPSMESWEERFDKQFRYYFDWDSNGRITDSMHDELVSFIAEQIEVARERRYAFAEKVFDGKIAAARKEGMDAVNVNITKTIEHREKQAQQETLERVREMIEKIKTHHEEWENIEDTKEYARGGIETCEDIIEALKPSLLSQPEKEGERK